MKKILDILKTDKPYIQIKELFDNGELRLIFPELCDLYTDEKGYKNNFLHTLGVLKNVCDFNNDLKFKIVALLHDIGKPKSKHNSNKGWTFHNHENIGAKMSIKILKEWGLNDDIFNDYIYRMIYYHGRTKMHRDVSESAIRRLDNEVGPDIIFDLIDFCKCDLTTKYEDKKQKIQSSLNTIKNRIIEVRQKDEESKWRSPLTGFIIMNVLNIEPSKIIGDIKKEIDPLLRSGEFTLDDAIKYIEKKYKKF